MTIPSTSSSTTYPKFRGPDSTNPAGGAPAPEHGASTSTAGVANPASGAAKVDEAAAGLKTGAKEQAKKGILESSKMPLGLLAAGALGFAAWRIKDSYEGNQERVKTLVDEHKTNNDFSIAQHQFGQFNGNPEMTDLSDRFMSLKTYGPMRIKEHWFSAKTHVKSFVSDVLLPNVLPLGVGLASLYAVKPKPFKKAGSWTMDKLRNVSMNGTLKRELGRLNEKVGKPALKHTGNMLKWPLTSLPAFAATAGLVTLGAFFAKRFHDTYNGDAQRDFYRDDIYMKRHE